jgi:ppGpp synthetase/RelA/SpoT-type nucleotidyltranferase
MNLAEYAHKHKQEYVDFATLVRDLLEKALTRAASPLRPQSIQCRAKSVDRLRQKLITRGLLDSQAIEHEIRDLASVRIIFYVNGDVDGFLESQLIQDNFSVDWDATRIHQPLGDQSSGRYRGIHYTV